MNNYVNLVEAVKIPTGRGLTVRVGNREIALFQLDGQVYALNGQCPHRGGPLGEGLTDQGRVYCPLHGWEFDIKTGACVDNPERPAACVTVRIVDGMVQMQMEPSSS